MGSRVLSLCQKRPPGDWREVFGHPLVLLVTFVDPQRFRGTIYKSESWLYVGDTRGFRRTHGRRHRLPTVLAIAAGAILCGMRGYRAISDWADSLGQKARGRFHCRREKGIFVVPSFYVIRDALVRVGPSHLDSALKR